MEEISSEREALTTTKCHRKLFQSVVAFAFLCVATSGIILVIIFCLLIEDCDGCRSFLGTTAFVLFIAGLMILLTIVFCKRRFRRRNSPTAQVVISFIPAKDLEKSPAPILPYNRVPRHYPFVDLAADCLIILLLFKRFMKFIHLGTRKFVQNAQKVPGRRHRLIKKRLK